MTSSRALRSRSTPSEPQRALALVPEVHGEQHARRTPRCRPRSRASRRRTPRRSGMPATRSSTSVAGRRRRRRTTMTSLCSGSSSAANAAAGRAGTRRRPARRARRPASACAMRPFGGQHGPELAADLLEAVGHRRSTTLPASASAWSAAVSTAASHVVATTTGRGRRRVSVGPRRERRHPVAPLLWQLVDDLAALRRVTRPGDDVVAELASRARAPCPRDRSPPAPRSACVRAWHGRHARPECGAYA